MLLFGCASLTEGSFQEIVVNTSPERAECNFTRDGMLIASIPETPSSATVENTGHDIVIECRREGFHQSTYYNKSQTVEIKFGNIAIGGGIAWIADSAFGHNNRYTSPVNMTLVPLSQPAPPPQYSNDMKAESGAAAQK